jgi:hypothetical protein
MDVAFVKAIADAIPDMGSLSSLNLASNSIGGFKDKSYPYKFHATPEGKALFWVVPLF